MTSPHTTHDEYVTQCAPEARARLMQVQREVERQVPDAVRCIGYNMPAFRQERIFLYFAAFKNHVGIYPPVTGDENLIAETSRYRGPKGNLVFPHGQEFPLDLIGRVARALAAQYSTDSSQTSAGIFRAEALHVLQQQTDRLRSTPDIAGALALPAASFEDIVLCGREAQLTIFRQADQPSPGQVLVTAQIARHGLGGVVSQRFEKGLVFSAGAPVRDATDRELLHPEGPCDG